MRQSCAVATPDTSGLGSLPGHEGMVATLGSPSRRPLAVASATNSSCAAVALWPRARRSSGRGYAPGGGPALAACWCFFLRSSSGSSGARRRQEAALPSPAPLRRCHARVGAAAQLPPEPLPAGCARMKPAAVARRGSVSFPPPPLPPGHAATLRQLLVAVLLAGRQAAAGSPRRCREGDGRTCPPLSWEPPAALAGVPAH